MDSLKTFSDLTNIAFIVSLVISLIQCFFGYKIIRSWIGILGFILGAAGGYGIVHYITADTSYALIGGIIGGLLLAVLAYKVYLAGVFLIAGIGTYGLCTTQLTLNIPAPYLQILSLILAVIVAVLAVKYMRPAIIIITAFLASFSVVNTLPAFITFDQTMAVPAAVGLGLAGSLVQFLTTKKK